MRATTTTTRAAIIRTHCFSTHKFRFLLSAWPLQTDKRADVHTYIHIYTYTTRGSNTSTKWRWKVKIKLKIIQKIHKEDIHTYVTPATSDNGQELNCCCCCGCYCCITAQHIAKYVSMYTAAWWTVHAYRFVAHTNSCQQVNFSCIANNNKNAKSKLRNSQQSSNNKHCSAMSVMFYLFT